MDVSGLGEIFNNGVDIRRKRKIQYKKCKGRLMQRSAGVLNKSLCRNLNKSRNTSDLNQSQVVFVKDINSFLKKNKELARALEDSRHGMKELEKQTLTYQLEILELRKSLCASQNAVLGCTCEKNPQKVASLNVDLLTSVHASIDQTNNLLNKYVTAIINERLSSGMDQTCCIEQMKLCSSVSTQCEPVRCKNKRLQVHTMSPKKKSICLRKHVEEIDEGWRESEDKQTQCNAKPCHDCAIQCSLYEQSSDIVGKKSLSDRSRVPLQILHTNSKENVVTQKETSAIRSIMKKASTSAPVRKRARLQPFYIYKDSPEENLTEKSPLKDVIGFRRVRIHSPAEVRYFNRSLDLSTDGRFKRAPRVCYKELPLNRKLSSSHPMVDRALNPSPRRKGAKKRKKRVKQPAAIALEDVISFVEQSFLV